MAYSHSQLQLFQTCPLKYRYEKVDKYKVSADEDIENLYFVLGTSVHSWLEELYKFTRNKATPTYAYVLWKYNEMWTGEIDRINNKFGREYFDKNDLENFHHRWVKYIERYYDKYHPFDQAITDSTEKNMWIEIKPNIKFTWKIDRFDISGNTAIIVDYKTNRSLPQNQYDIIKDQIGIYGLAIQQDYGDKFDKIIGKVIYLHLEKEYTRELTPDIINEIKSKYLYIIDDIEKKKIEYAMWNELAFEPTPWRHCEECPFQRICPIYKHKYDQSDTVQIEDLGPITIRNLIDKIYDLGIQSRDLEAKKSYYLEILREYAIKKWYTYRLRWNTTKLRLDKRNEYIPISTKKDDLIGKLKIDWRREDVKKEDIDKTKLDTLFKNHKLNIEDFDGLVKYEDKLTIWRPSKITDKDLEENQDEIGK